jgi:long-subunit fatty acid transport protein
MHHLNCLFRIFSLSTFLCVSVVNLRPALGQTYENPLVNTVAVGARPAGMGNAFLAVADDFSAIYYNPAGITQIKRFELAATLLQQRTDATTSFYNESHTYPYRATKLGSGGLILPYPTYRGSLVFAAGVYRPVLFDRGYGLRKQWSADSLLYQTEEVAGNLTAWALAGGIDVSPRAAVGAALNVYTGAKSIVEEGKPIRDSSFYYRETSERTYLGAHVRLGALVKLNQYIKCALVMETPLSLHENGTLQTQESSQADLTPLSYNQTTTLEEIVMEIPFKFSAGLAGYISSLVVAVDMEYVDWTQLREQNRLDKDHREVVNGRFGCEYIIPHVGVKIRSGFQYQPVVFKSVVVEKERQTLTLGMGALLDTMFTIDVAGVYATWDQQSTTWPAYLKAPHESYRNLTVYLSTAYRF